MAEYILHDKKVSIRKENMSTEAYLEKRLRQITMSSRIMNNRQHSLYMLTSKAQRHVERHAIP